MSSLYYLLSSSEGYPISKCCFNNKLQEPNWKSIARLIAFIANIFPKREATQFSDGNRTFFCQPQETATGACFFVTLFTEDGDSTDLSSLCRYIGYVISRLFQASLEECLSFLKGRMSDLVQKSTYQDTLQEDSVSDAGDSHNDKVLQLGNSSIMESLNAFEEHFIVELLLIGQSFSQHWFSPILDYCSKVAIAPEKQSVKICAAFNVSAEGLLSKLFSNFDLENHSGCSYEDLEMALLQYNNAITPISLSEEIDPDQKSGVSREFGLSQTADRSHLLRIPAAKCDSDICAEKGFYLAVSKFFQVSFIGIRYLCHLTQEILFCGTLYFKLPFELLSPILFIFPEGSLLAFCLSHSINNN